MKNRVPPGAVIALIVVAVIAIAFAYRSLSGHAPASVSEDTLKKYMEKKEQDPWVQQSRKTGAANAGARQ
jgi:hypothetical protein